MKLSALKTDAALIEQGRWIDQIPEMGELRLKVRGLGNTSYRCAFDKKVTAVPQAKKIRGLDPVERDRIVAECLAETVLLDWDGLTGDDNAPVPYDPDLARRLLVDPDFVRFRGAVTWAASIVADETSEGIKDDAKNS